jgi:hypothetical protein
MFTRKLCVLPLSGAAASSAAGDVHRNDIESRSGVARAEGITLSSQRPASRAGEPVKSYFFFFFLIDRLV